MFATDDHLFRSTSVHPIFVVIGEWFHTLLEIKVVTEAEMYHSLHGNTMLHDGKQGTEGIIWRLMIICMYVTMSNEPEVAPGMSSPWQNHTQLCL